MATDPRFNTMENRVKHNDQVTAIIENWLQEFEKVSDATAFLQSHRIMAGPVLSVGQVIEEDPQCKAREMLREIEHPTLGPIKVLNTPLHFRNSRACFDEPPSVMAGEHTDYALHDLLNLSDEEIEKLQQEGVIFSPESPTN